MTTPKFAVSDLKQYITPTGYRIVAYTFEPSHLWMRWTTAEPQEHTIPRTIRGVPLPADKRFCFVAYEDNEQEEEGDTLIHTFIKEPWPVCETRYFFFTGGSNSTTSPSTTAIFKKHRLVPYLFREEYNPEDFGATAIFQDHYIPEPDETLFTHLATEGWWTALAPGEHILITPIKSNTDEALVWWTGTQWKFDWPHFAVMAGYMAPDAYKLGSGLRFTNITIPPGSTILQAYLGFIAARTFETVWVWSKITAELNPNPSPFTDLADFQSRPLGPATIDWGPIPTWHQWAFYKSPELKTPIQWVIDHPDWHSGNALVLFWDDFLGRSFHSLYTLRMAYSYEHLPEHAPFLYIRYTT